MRTPREPTPYDPVDCRVVATRLERIATWNELDATTRRQFIDTVQLLRDLADSIATTR